MTLNFSKSISRLPFSIFYFIPILMLGCGTEIIEVEEKIGPPEKPELSQDSKIFLGNRLFSEKTCIKCHAVDLEKKGPSVVEIMEIYKNQNADIVAFLKGNSEPIVDTTRIQVAIMQDNIDGFLKKITDVELDAIATYMMHVDAASQKKDI